MNDVHLEVKVLSINCVLRVMVEVKLLASEEGGTAPLRMRELRAKLLKILAGPIYLDHARVIVPLDLYFCLQVCVK